MKFYSALALAALPAVQAMPRGPMGGVEIRDESVLAELKAQHKHTLEALKQGKGITPKVEQPAGGEHDKRFVIFGLAGMALVEAGGAIGGIAGGLANRLAGIFTGDDQEQIWHNHGHCRTYFETQGGGHCKVQTYDKDAGDATATHEEGAGSWNDPDNTDPPVVFYEGDQGMGKYSFQYTATSNNAWDGIDGTEKCPFEGLCNPSVVFYRDGYNIVLNTWQSQGEISACQYSGGEDCKGLCSSGVKDQFSSGGVTWGGDCAIPCEGEEGLPEQGSK